MNDNNQYIIPLNRRGDAILNQNLSNGEKILAKLQGDFGQALVLTNLRLYIVKWGFQTGNTFGGKCIAYEYRNITAVELRKHALSRLFIVLTPATQDNGKLSYWASRGKSNNAQESDFAVTFARKYEAEFQAVTNLARQLISKSHHSAAVPAHDDSLDQLERLAALKQKGIITDQEFQAKKKQLLGL